MNTPRTEGIQQGLIDLILGRDTTRPNVRPNMRDDLLRSPGIELQEHWGQEVTPLGCGATR